MRTSIILARKHGSTEFELVADPSVSMLDQTKAIREALALGGVHEEFAEVQHWDSTHGLQRTIRFHSPEGKKADEDRIARDNKLQEEAIAEAKKPKKAAKDTKPKPDAPESKKADEKKEPEKQSAQVPGTTDL